MKQQFIKPLFEDENLICFLKPGLMHSTGIDSFEAIINKNCKDLIMLQRLDFETSGVVCFAKNIPAKEKWDKLYEAGMILKRYLLLVENFNEKEVLFSGYFGSRYRGSKKVSFDEKEKKRFQFAETKFKKFKSGKGASLVIAETYFGRRHQVRVSAAEAGFPLIGDVLYGGKKTGNPFFLHAWKLKIDKDEIVASLSDEQEEFLTKWGLIT